MLANTSVARAYLALLNALPSDRTNLRSAHDSTPPTKQVPAL